MTIGRFANLSDEKLNNLITTLDVLLNTYKIPKTIDVVDKVFIGDNKIEVYQLDVNPKEYPIFDIIYTLSTIEMGLKIKPAIRLWHFTKQSTGEPPNTLNVKALEVKRIGPFDPYYSKSVE